MSEIKMFKALGNKIGFPRTPCRWIGRPKYKTVTVVRMSCGGGMGGASWKEYLEEVEVQPGLNKYARIDGTEVTLNGNFIVKAENFLMAEVTYLPSNPHFDDGVTKHKGYIIVPHKKMVLVDEYKEWKEF